MRACLRISCFVFAFVAVSAGLLAFLDAFEAPYRFTGIEDMPKILDALEGSRQDLGDDSVYQVVFFGDSTAVFETPAKLEGAVNALLPAERQLRVTSIAGLGMSPYEYYFLTGEVLRQRPDHVVIDLNLSMLSPARSFRFARPGLAGWLPPSMLPEAMSLPLLRLGLTLDRVLLYMGIVRLGGADPWLSLQREQVRLDQSYRELERWLEQRGETGDELGYHKLLHRRSEARQRHPERTFRLSLAGARQRYGPVLDLVGAEHPELLLLDATLAAFERAGVPALVYVTPVNVQHLQRLELDLAGLEATISTLEEIARSRDAEFVDLHDLLPNQAFKDRIEHFKLDPPWNGSVRVAKQLAPRLVSQMQERGRLPAAANEAR
jgi:hypothetical protein